jgi:hypothetical protein
MTTPTRADKDLAALRDQIECQRVIAQYSASIDWADREGLTAMFWPDARFDFGPAFFIGSCGDAIDFLVDSVKNSVVRTHALGATWVKIDENEARAESPAINVWLQREPDGSLTRYFFTARYLWQLQKRLGQWRASALSVLINTAQCTPYDEKEQPPGFAFNSGLGVDHARFPGKHL